MVSVPVGLSVAGCAKKSAPVEYCNSGDSGPVLGQVAQIILSPSLATVGESLNYGQIGQGLSASALDCKGNSVSVTRYTYASTSSYNNSSNGTIFADINPFNGQVCGGTWNRNTGGGVADYTTCTAPTATPPPTPISASLTTPTTPTATTGAATLLQLAFPTDLLSGNIILGLGTGTQHSISLPALSTLSAVASQIDADTTFKAEGITAAYNASTGALTITGPAGAANTLLTTGSQLTDNIVAFLSAPTTASASSASTTTLVLSQVTDVVSGTLQIAVGTGATHSISVVPGTTLSALASQINLDPVFAPEGVSAAYNAGSATLTLSGPVGAANTLSTAGTQLLDTPIAYLAYVTATAQGAVSNAIPVYVHPTATGVVLGGATPGASNGSCPVGTVDPGTDCCPNSTVGTPVAAPIYNGTGCLSQNHTGQLVARVYTGGNTLPVNNITCQVGHLTYGAQNASNVVTIDQNGVATAGQPGSTEITATIAQSSTATNAGFFATCPPASIALSVTGQTGTSITLPINNTIPISATVTDTAGNSITGLSLEFNSTSPQNIPGGAGQVTPIYPGTANITAVCQPSSCNPSGFSQIGIFGNGKPVTSNSVNITATGQSGTVLYAGSLQTATSPGSQYLYTQDFTTSQPGSLIKLPYAPNSLVITLSGQSIFMGSSGGLMNLTTANNTVSAAIQTVSGTVLSVSPDASTIVVTDPVRQTISLYGPTGNLISAYGGIGTRAVWSPDNQTVYVTTTTGLVLEHGTFTDWQQTTAAAAYNDVAITVPSVGAYFAGPSSTDGRSYCSSTSNIVAGNPPTAVNAFLPLADSDPAIVDRLIATNDGLHILGAHVPVSGPATFTDINVSLPIAACPAVIPPNYFKSAPFTKPLTTSSTTVAATSITGIVPSSNAALAFVTYAGTSGLLPYYLVPTPGSFGTLQYVTLSSGTAPLSGVFSTDNLTFYVGTAGDDLIHQIAVTYPTSGSPTAVDSGTLNPQLPSASGTGFAPVSVIVQRPKKATN